MGDIIEYNHDGSGRGDTLSTAMMAAVTTAAAATMEVAYHATSGGICVGIEYYHNVWRHDVTPSTTATMSASTTSTLTADVGGSRRDEMSNEYW